ncbi:MAG: type II toxin-antitoxin system RelE/ParE family toxin [Herpetosiphonaceae bacterium]|nr:type II toxin-antitoxin system RelE/ParE family toxin [Herpetosiphonaceae bacterium]
MALGDTPRPHGYKALVGEPGYRIREGKYRVVYEIDDTAQRVVIIKVGPWSKL